MTEIPDALARVLAEAAPLAPQRGTLTYAALGRVLAEDLRADRDAPPFDQALMDGYAVRVADLPGGSGELTAAPEVPAGTLSAAPLAPGHAAPIFTGAPLPEGADAVIKVELSERAGARVRLADPGLTVGRNVLRRGEAMARGQVVIPAGARVTPAAVGLAASIGAAEALLVPAPRVAVLATGSELAEPGTTPAAAQIRNSNGPMLLALVARAGGTPVDLGQSHDDAGELRRLVRAGLDSADVLVTSGGVSVGDYDLLPGVFDSLGIVVEFHQVRMKPGKPLLFGTLDIPGGAKRLVFGLPGNPVSTLVCFERFVRPALRLLAGHPAGAGPATAALVEPLRSQSDRPSYSPGAFAGPGAVRPLPNRGSAQLLPWLGAECLVELPAGAHDLRAGEAVAVIDIR